MSTLKNSYNLVSTTQICWKASTGINFKGNILFETLSQHPEILIRKSSRSFKNFRIHPYFQSEGNSCRLHISIRTKIISRNYPKKWSAVSLNIDSELYFIDPRKKNFRMTDIRSLCVLHTVQLTQWRIYFGRGFLASASGGASMLLKILQWFKKLKIGEGNFWIPTIKLFISPFYQDCTWIE